MATQPPASLPLFYKNLVPLQSGVHTSFRTHMAEKAPFFAGAHAIPVTIDEFVNVQRFNPIVFSVGETPVPLALFGLNEGVNVYLEADGSLKQPIYVPAYVRRYPWMLARLAPDSQELSLCFDPDSGLVGEDGTGPALFDGDKVSEATNAVLKFCEDFEMSAQKTAAFVAELQKMDLLMDGEVAINVADQEQPYIYRGFQMVSEEKFRALDTAALKTIHDNGILALILAHMFSLSLVREIFGMQMGAGQIQSQTVN